MRRGRTLFWLIIGSVVTAVAVVIAVILVNSGAPPKAASSPAPSISASANPQATKSAPVIIPRTSSGSPFSYLSDLKPSGKFGSQVQPGRVKISGSIYPKSISFYCNNGDPNTTPAYRLKQNAHQFKATIGIEARFPSNFTAAVFLIGDGHHLRTFNVGVSKPKTVTVKVTEVHILSLECFSSGTSSTEGWSLAVALGNARVTEGH
jgi:hypothetical protein